MNGEGGPGEAERPPGDDGRRPARRSKGTLRAAPRNAAEPARRRKGERAAEADLGPLSNYIAFHLRLAQELALRAFARRSGKADFRPGHFAILMVIRLNPGISQSALGRAIGRDKSTISPLIRALQARNLIARRPSSGDRRSVTLSLTRAGESELDELLRHVEAHDRRLDEIVGDDKPRLIALLRKIADAFS
ncbi:MAG TPA: MarR family transcriptional regulator [Roseiarcus sp.]|nr:MarR family transcriptional regulator [Roseiarcus sp.]